MTPAGIIYHKPLLCDKQAQGKSDKTKFVHLNILRQFYVTRIDEYL